MAHRHEGKCPGCHKPGALTKHHLFPVRFFGKGKHNDNILLLCRSCHNEMEKMIPLKDALEKWQYLAIAARFLRERRL